MRRAKAVIFSILALSVIPFACHKDDPAPAATMEQLLETSKGWKLTDETLTSPANVTQSTLNQNDACVLDNITFFKDGGGYLEDEGATKCDAADPQTVEAGTWKFNTDKTALTITSSDLGNSIPIVFTVVTLTSTTLALKTNFDLGGSNYILTATYAPVK